MNLAIKLISIAMLTIIGMAAFLWFGLPLAAFITFVVGIGISIISILIFIRGKGIAGWYPDLEKEAEILVLSNDMREIRNFAMAKKNYLSKRSFQSLLNRISELNTDNVIFEHNLKQRIEETSIGQDVEMSEDNQVQRARNN